MSTTTTGLDDVNEDIARSGGSFFKLTHKEHGTIEGTLLGAEKRVKTFEGKEVLSRSTGKPRHEWVLTLQTEMRDADQADDDGVRRVSCNEGLQIAIREELRRKGAKLEYGGRIKLGVKQDPETPTSQAVYGAVWTPPQPAVDIDTEFI